MLQVLVLVTPAPHLAALLAAANWVHVMSVTCRSITTASLSSSTSSSVRPAPHAWALPCQLLMVALTHALLPALLLRLRCAAAERQAAGSLMPAQRAAGGKAAYRQKAILGYRHSKQCTDASPARQKGSTSPPAAARSSDPLPHAAARPASSHAAIAAAAVRDVARAPAATKSACVATAQTASGQPATPPGIITSFCYFSAGAASSQAT